MRKFHAILFALIFLLSSSLTLAASVRTCCADEMCPAAQCADMGCLPAGVAPMAVDNVQPPTALAVAQVHWTAPAAALPHPEKEVWTPPD